MEEVCIIVQTAFFNKDNELIDIKYESRENIKEHINDFMSNYKNLI